MKILNTDQVSDTVENLKKEIYVHKLLKHEHIIKFLGHREDGNLIQNFLEYAPGGQLFNRIKTYIGMPQQDAQKYFNQLISGVEYLHSLGIAHRDLKPQNLLLDNEGVLKISDFGMATVFRHKGKVRLSKRCCGTLPYIAPEVHLTQYSAEPADIWGCGIVLVMLLSGELPWDKATVDFEKYRAWTASKITESPWNRLDHLVLSLLKKILTPNPSQRYTIPQIKSHAWFTKSLLSDSQQLSDIASTSSKHLCSDSSQLYPPHRDETVTRPSSSQPEVALAVPGMSFSQPAHLEDTMLSSQMMPTPGPSQSPYQRPATRMTRFIVNTSFEDTMRELKLCFDLFGYGYKVSQDRVITLTTQDKRNMQLVFKADVLEMNPGFIVDFRLSHGDRLEFKKHFVKIRSHLRHIIAKGPVT